jgi:uncharacterized protein YjeT (DUF2065 family)
MSKLSLMSIIFGIVIIVGRAPLVFAPDTTLRLVRRILHNKSSLRIVGIFTAVLGVALIASAWGADQSAALIIFWLGWVLVFAAVVELVFTSFVQRIANAIWNMNNVTARMLGLFSIVVGAFFVYLGIVVFQQ